MTNEQYLYVSYFAAAAVGLSLAAITAAILARPHRLATAGTAISKLATILRRVFPAWLVLAVLLGFVSVSYFDCGHSSYNSIITDRPHLISKTQEHASHMAMYLAIAVVAYGFVLITFLWARARHSRLNQGGGASAAKKAEALRSPQ